MRHILCVSQIDLYEYFMCSVDVNNCVSILVRYLWFILTRCASHDSTKIYIHINGHKNVYPIDIDVDVFLWWRNHQISLCYATTLRTLIHLLRNMKKFIYSMNWVNNSTSSNRIKNHMTMNEKQLNELHGGKSSRMCRLLH